MALINPPAWLQQGSYPAKTDRQVIESIVPVEGVMSGFSVTQTPTASMSVNIGAGKAFVAGTSVALQGMYNVINDAPFLVALPGSNQTNPRYDLIVITVNDADVSGSVNSVEFKVISGVPSSNPQVPSIPPSTLVLARIYVGAGVPTVASSSITDVRIWTAPRGGVITVPDAASRLRLSAPAGETLLVSESSTGLMWRLQGSAWSPISGESYVCTSTSRPTGVPVGFKVWETDTKQERLWDGNSWVWCSGVRPFGRMQKTTGFQSVSVGTPAIQAMTREEMFGGVTYSGGGTGDQSNPGYLVIKDTGLYRVKCVLYVSGAPSRVVGSVIVNNGTAGAAGDITVTDVVMVEKSVAADASSSGDMILNLTAGQRVRMTVSAQTATTNTYGVGGTSAVRGLVTAISVEWVGTNGY